MRLSAPGHGNCAHLCNAFVDWHLLCHNLPVWSSIWTCCATTNASANAAYEKNKTRKNTFSYAACFWLPSNQTTLPEPFFFLDFLCSWGGTSHQVGSPPQVHLPPLQPSSPPFAGAQRASWPAASPCGVEAAVLPTGRERGGMVILRTPLALQSAKGSGKCPEPGAASHPPPPHPARPPPWIVLRAAVWKDTL